MGKCVCSPFAVPPCNLLMPCIAQRGRCSKDSKGFQAILDMEVAHCGQVCLDGLMSPSQVPHEPACTNTSKAGVPGIPSA